MKQRKEGCIYSSNYAPSPPPQKKEKRKKSALFSQENLTILVYVPWYE